MCSGNSGYLMKFLLTAFLLILSCAALPISPAQKCERVPVGPGPEDFVLDLSVPGGRILVSSHERRTWERGEIYAVDPGNSPARILKREGEPADLFFSPHGMDLRRIKGRNLLFVISHGAHVQEGKQQVLVYELTKDILRFSNIIESPLFTSPNDLAVDESGGFYVSNDAHSRGSFLEMALALKRASVVYCPPEAGNTDCLVAAQGLAMANSAAVRGNSVFISTTRSNEILRFDRRADGRLENPLQLFQGPMLDNLFFHEDNPEELLVASHPSGMAFLRHAKDANKPSPSVVYAVHTQTGASRVLYANDGKEISAASGAFLLNKVLYISQVFEPFLLRCDRGAGFDHAGKSE